MAAPLDPFKAKAALTTASGAVEIFRLDALTKAGIGDVSRLPYSMKVLLESALRNCDDYVVTRQNVAQLAQWKAASPAAVEVPFLPARVVLQDFTGVPCVVDLAAMRAHMKRVGGDPKKINPQVPVDLVIDHSVQVDAFGSPEALTINSDLEFNRNKERYEFLNWGRKALANFRVVPPATGIVHQVNLEFLASVVAVRNGVAFPDSLVGTDSHTTMINGLGVVGWGVGGIEAEAVMLNQPIYMLLPQVIGFKLTGRLPEGSTATDLVLTVTQMLRKKGVVDKFVEFFGPGLSNLSLADRATIANMAPEYGATIGFFPVDAETLRYLNGTGRPKELVDLVERYSKEQGLFRTDSSPDPVFTDVLALDLGTVEPSLAGPKRPQDRVPLKDMKPAFRKALAAPIKENGFALAEPALTKSVDVADARHGGKLANGSVVIAAITSCTNTSNPSVMIGAGVLARKAVERGLSAKPWVKTSLAPGSRVVSDYLDKAGLTPYLEKLNFHTVGYGCTTCIGNSGPLPPPIADALARNTDLVAASVLSGNRNFEGRVHPQVKANYLAGPPLVVAYALAGSVDVDLIKDPLGTGKDGKPVFLKDIWPTQAEVAAAVAAAVTPEAFRARYNGVFESNARWNAVAGAGGDTYVFDPKSTYVREPPYFKDMADKPSAIGAIRGARVLVAVGDSVTTDHISPAGDIEEKGAAGQYLVERGIPKADFNSYGARRGNHEVMVRGTYANVRVRNILAGGKEGGWTTFLPTGEVMTIYDASTRYAATKTPLVVLAGKDYGMGSSRDWAAKGVLLLGVKAVIAESYERIHRSNLVGMGVLPLQYLPGQTRESLGLTGKEVFDIGVAAPEPAAKPAEPSDDSVEFSGQFSIVDIQKQGAPGAAGKSPPAGGAQFSDELSAAGVAAALGSVGLLNDVLRPKQEINVIARDPARPNEKPKVFKAVCRIDTPVEVDYYRNGGILPTVLRKLAKR